MNPISLILVIHNEEARIAGFLRQVYPLVSQIVMVDQASTDCTRVNACGTLMELDLERQLRNEPPVAWHIYDDKCRGFSEASNPMALSHCTEPWVLVLFPDETIMPAFAADLPNLLYRGDTDGWQIKRSTYVDDGLLVADEPTIRLVLREQIHLEPLLHRDPECKSGRLGRPTYTALEHRKTGLEQHADNMRYFTIGNGEGVA